MAPEVIGQTLFVKEKDIASDALLVRVADNNVYPVLIATKEDYDELLKRHGHKEGDDVTKWLVDIFVEKAPELKKVYVYRIEVDNGMMGLVTLPEKIKHVFVAEEINKEKNNE